MMLRMIIKNGTMIMETQFLRRIEKTREIKMPTMAKNCN